MEGRVGFGGQSFGQLKVLMGILREQNDSPRWLWSVYLAAGTQGSLISYKIPSRDHKGVFRLHTV